MNGKWTPGPWEARFRFGRKTTVAGRQRYPICDTGTAPRGESNDRRDEANAQLIAAAPAMAEALENAEAALSGVLASMPNLPTIEAVRDQCRAALSQTLGEGQP